MSNKMAISSLIRSDRGVFQRNVAWAISHPKAVSFPKTEDIKALASVMDRKTALLPGRCEGFGLPLACEGIVSSLGTSENKWSFISRSKSAVATSSSFSSGFSRGADAWLWGGLRWLRFAAGRPRVLRSIIHGRSRWRHRSHEVSSGWGMPNGPKLSRLGRTHLIFLDLHPAQIKRAYLPRVLRSILWSCCMIYVDAVRLRYFAQFLPATTWVGEQGCIKFDPYRTEVVSLECLLKGRWVLIAQDTTVYTI